MPHFISNVTNRIVQAVQLKFPLQSERGLPPKDIEKTAWAGDWFVVGEDGQGWLSDSEFTNTHKQVFIADAALGIPVVHSLDKDVMGEVRMVELDPGKGKLTITF